MRQHGSGGIFLLERRVCIENKSLALKIFVFFKINFIFDDAYMVKDIRPYRPLMIALKKF